MTASSAGVDARSPATACGRGEALPWIAAAAALILVPEYLALGGQILVMILFALSLDLVLGYAGIVTLGHAAFFGFGAYVAGILAVRGSAASR